MQALDDGIQLDRFGRMLYHPDFHPNHKKPYTVEDIEYLCKFWEYDHRRSLAYALGRPEHSLASVVNRLRKEGLYEYYKSLNKHW